MNNLHVMNDEQRKALVHRIKDLQEDQLSHWTGVYPGSELDRKIWEIALAALTAPVPALKLPNEASEEDIPFAFAVWNACLDEVKRLNGVTQ